MKKYFLTYGDKKFNIAKKHLSLLAKKLLRHFNQTHTEWGVMVKDHLRVVYENDNSNIEVAYLYMKMKSYSEEENKEMFNRGTAHMIAYLIYDYDKYGRYSEVSKFIEEYPDLF